MVCKLDGTLRCQFLEHNIQEPLHGTPSFETCKYIFVAASNKVLLLIALTTARFESIAEFVEPSHDGTSRKR